MMTKSERRIPVTCVLLLLAACGGAAETPEVEVQRSGSMLFGEVRDWSRGWAALEGRLRPAGAAPAALPVVARGTVDAAGRFALALPAGPPAEGLGALDPPGMFGDACTAAPTPEPPALRLGTLVLFAERDGREEELLLSDRAFSGPQPLGATLTRFVFSDRAGALRGAWTCGAPPVLGHEVDWRLAPGWNTLRGTVVEVAPDGVFTRVRTTNAP